MTSSARFDRARSRTKHPASTREPASIPKRHREAAPRINGPRGGFDYLGDDHNGLRLDENDVCWGYSYYNAARIGEGHLRHFPELAPHEVPPHSEWDEKSLVYMSRIIPERMVARTRIDAVVLPKIVGGAETRIRKVSRIESLLALAPSTLKIPLSPGIDGLMNLTEFIPRIACYRLELGDDVRQIPRCIERILDKTPPPAACDSAHTRKAKP